MKFLGVSARALVFVLALLAFACQRSPQFKKEEEFGREDASAGYLGSGGSSRPLTQRVDSLVQPKKRVMVLNFWNNTPVPQGELGSFAADELRRGLHLSQRVIVPLDASSDLKTEDFIQGDQVRVAQLIREGRRLGVSLLVIGRITRIVFRQRGDEVGLFRQKQSLAAVDIEAKIFDVQGGREIMATSKSGEANNSAVVAFESNQIESAAYRSELTRYAVRQAVAGFIPDVVKSVDKMAWQGRIAKLIGQRVYVNAGRASGLISGDILRVLTPGDEIYDPISGTYLGRSDGHLKGTLEVVDFIGTDGAVAKTHTGGNFKEGDLVQLY